MKKIVLIIICVSSVALGGLLRLHNGQIQQQLENGKWKCANEEVRKIMNERSGHTGDGTVPWEYDNDGRVRIIPTSKSNTMEISGKGQFVNEDSSYVRLRYEDDGEFISFVDGTPDTERSISIEPHMPFKTGGATVEWTGHYRIDIPVFDPNDWTIVDSFIRGMCESGRVCEVMGHQWKELGSMYWDDISSQIVIRPRQRCDLCGKMRFQTTTWSEEGEEQ